MLLFCFTGFNAFFAQAQDKYTGEKEAPYIVYDEIPVLLIVQGYKNYYVDVIYSNQDSLYINIEDLFKPLNIQCKIGQRGDSLGGFIGIGEQNYSIDYNQKQIKVGNTIYYCGHKLIRENSILYLESSMFSEAFGIILTFNFRNLSVFLKSNFELPIIKQNRVAKLRTNIAKVKGESSPDTILNRKNHLIKFGSLDWAFVSTQIAKEQTDNRFRLGLGGEILMGEVDVSVDYNNIQKFDDRQLQYMWRWVNNDNTIIKQAQVGKIYPSTVSYIGSQLVGATIRNTPTNVRKAKGYYTISETTEPNWTVELYINDVLVDYTTADVSGLFVFKVPIVYGYTTLKLKFYGPMGEERIEERTLNIPYSFMPTNEFEYGITAGVVQDSSSNRFSKVDFNYGVGRFFTLGGGVEYLSSIENNPYIPTAKSVFQPFSDLTINLEYAGGVRSRAVINYNLSRNIIIDLDYSKYVEGQTATTFHAPEERKVRLSLPFRSNRFNGYFKVDYTELVYSDFSYKQSNAVISAYYKRININSSTQLNWLDNKVPYTNSELAIAYRTKSGILLRSAIRYNFNDKSFISYKAEIEKRLFRTYISASYENYPSGNNYYACVNVKYDLSFARTNALISRNKEKVITSQSASGSIAFGAGNGYARVSNNSAVGKGGILLYPFLDKNGNGKFDKGEKMVQLSAVTVMGGKAIYSEKDTIIRIPDLNAFINYNVEFNDNDLPTMSWRFKYKKYQVLVDPNQFKRVDIPIIVVGEVSGMTYMNKNNVLKGIGRILVNVYTKRDKHKITEILSESDGYVNYLGLAPGIYTACVDSAQLKNLGYIATPNCIEFTINETEEGDIKDGLDFILKEQEQQFQAIEHVKETVPEPGITPLEINQLTPDIKTPHGPSRPSDESLQSPDYSPSSKIDYPAFDVEELLEDTMQSKHSSSHLQMEELSNHRDSIAAVTAAALVLPLINVAENKNEQTSMFKIQVGAFLKQANAISAQKKIVDLYKVPVDIIQLNGLYKVLVTGFLQREQAVSMLQKLKANGFPGAFIIQNNPNTL